MSLQRLFIRTKRSIGGLTVDGTISEAHSTSVAITKNPVEFGADISDHAIVQPAKVTIQGIVTDTPLFTLTPAGVVAAIQSIGSTFISNSSPSSVGYARLLQMQLDAEPITIQTKLVTYTQMIITNLRVLQDKKTNNVVKFTLDAENIIIVETEIVSTPSSQLEAGKITEQASSVVESGRKVAVEVEAGSTIGKTIETVIRGAF